MNRSWRQPISWFFAGLMVLGGEVSHAAEPGHSPRVLTVNDSNPAAWPVGPWQAVPRREYLALVEAQSRKLAQPKMAWIQHAAYSARLDGSRLHGGELTLQVFNKSTVPVAVSLDPLGLAVETLVHKKREAPWGITSAGHAVLIVPPGPSTHTGRWSLSGRTVASLREFSLSVAPAILTTFTIDAPSGLRLETSDGRISLPAAPAAATDQQRRRWQLALGRRTRCRLLVTRDTKVPRQPARLLVRNRTSCEIGTGGARIVTELVLESLGRPVQHLVLALPLDARVESILYDGLSVESRRIDSSGRQTWHITLPDPLPHAVSGPGRVLQVTAESDFNPASDWSLPSITIVDSQVVAGDLKAPQPDLTLNVREPLELKTFQATGFRQTADAVGGRRLTFSRFTEHPSLRLRLGVPQQSLTADVLARLDRGPTGWTAATEIAWMATSGASYTTRARLAPGWNIVDLKPVDPATRLEWRSILVAGNRQELIVEWSDAVDATTARPLLVQLKRPSGDLTADDLPLIEPIDCDQHRMLVALVSPLANKQLIAENGGSLVPVGLESLEEPWPTFSSFDAVTEDIDGGLFRWSATTAAPDSPSRPVTGNRSTEAPGTEPEIPASPPQSVASETEVTAGEQTGATGVGHAVAMHLQSRLAPSGADRDHHVARVTFDGAAFRRPFRFSLASPNDLDVVLVNGQVAQSETDGKLISIPPLEQGTFRTIEIRYTAPASNGFLASQRTIPVPGIDEDVSFTWIVAVAPGLLTGDQPGQPGQFDHSIQNHWSTRWLGPLGRGGHGQVFNPFSLANWQDLFKGATEKTTGLAFNAGLPANWSSWRRFETSSPEQLTLTLIRHDRLTALAWLVFLSLLGVGLHARATDQWPSPRFSAVAVASLVLVGWWIPAPWTLLTGAGLAAILLVLLLPESLWWFSRRTDPALTATSIGSFENGPLGSTRTFQNFPPAGIGLLLAAACFGRAMAQDPPQATPPAAEKKAAARPDVLVPIDRQGRPSQEIPFAFVRPALLDTLRRNQRLDDVSPAAILRRADYTGTVHADGRLDLAVRFEVVVMSRKGTVRLALPVDGANLGPDACHVNGQRHPLVRSDQGTFELALPPFAAPGKPAITPAPSAGRIDLVELNLRPTVRPAPNGGLIDLMIPGVLNSHLHLVVPRSTTRLEVPTAIALPSAEMPKQRRFHLPGIRRLQISWSNNQETPPTPPRTTASVQPSCLVEVHPLESRIQYRLPITVSGGDVSFVTLMLPKELMFRPRDIQSPDLLAVRPLPASNSRQRVIVEFKTPQKKKIELKLTGRLPVKASRSRIGLAPALEISHGTPPVPVVARPWQLGVSPAAGFRIVAVSPLPTGITAADVGEFTRVWQGPESSSPVATLSWTFNRPLTLPLDIHPLQPRRQVRLEQFLRIRPDRMELTITASAKTTGSSVFQHSLLIDPRLKINTIRIRQRDGAERLAHSARIGKRLVLYLKDANRFQEEMQIGIQNITIRGELPLQLPGKVILPGVTFEDAEIDENMLSLYHPPQLGVSLNGAVPLTQPSEDSIDSSPAVDAQQVLAGRFTLPDKETRVELDIRRKRLPSPLQLLYRLDHRPMETNWRLRLIAKSMPGPLEKGPLRIEIEPELTTANTEDSPLEFSPSPDTQVRDDDGRLVARYESIDSVTLDSTLAAAPESGNWSVPLPRLVERVIRSRFLLVSANADWRPVGDVTRLPQLPKDLFDKETEVQSHEMVWRIDGPNWELARPSTPTSSTSPAAKPQVAKPPPARTPRRIIQPAKPHNQRSPWWITLQVLVSITFAGVIAWDLSRPQDASLLTWLRRHDPAAWLVIGCCWWLGGVAGGLGLLLITMTLALVIRRGRRGQHRPATIPPLAG